MSIINPIIGLRRARTALSLALLFAPLAACEAITGDDNENGTFYGAAVQLGNGLARSYVVLEDGATTEMGVALSENSLQGLPAGHAGQGHDHTASNERLLALPENHGTPFKFIQLDWNPNGHEPAGIYDKPHFDFHFYTITEAERNAIDPKDPQYAAKAARFPAAEYVPQGFKALSDLVGAPPAAVAVPRMGMHWLDPANSPELAGQPFTKTFIYGTWDGKLIFAEPMITRAFIESKPNVTIPFGTAQKYAPAGQYPSAYRIYWEAGKKEYRIALSGFAAR